MTEQRRDRMESLNHLVQMLAIVGAGVWGIYTFIYQAKIVPRLAPPTLTVTSTLEKAGQRGDLIAIRSTVTRNNVGQTAIRLLGLTYDVYGIKARFEKAPNQNPEFDQAIGAVRSIGAARYYAEPPTGELILYHGKLFQGATELPSQPSVLNPEESVSRDMIFYADRSRFDSIRFQVRLWYSKESDPPIPLVLQRDQEQQLIAVPGPPCESAPKRCRGLSTTDFATELSLW